MLESARDLGKPPKTAEAMDAKTRRETAIASAQHARHGLPSDSDDMRSRPFSRTDKNTAQPTTDAA